MTCFEESIRDFRFGNEPIVERVQIFDFSSHLKIKNSINSTRHFSFNSHSTMSTDYCCGYDNSALLITFNRNCNSVLRTQSVRSDRKAVKMLIPHQNSSKLISLATTVHNYSSSVTFRCRY